MPAARILLIAAFAVLAIPSHVAAVEPEAEPELALRADWFQIVEPYRYVEERRFERGWNRGAGVLVQGGRIRTPVGGRVRFAGTVAGRGVLTIDARIDGMPVVVTMTGLERSLLPVGARVRPGMVVAAGRRVHVGAYDPRRRSRYLPVRAVEQAAPARADPDPGSPVANVIAERLLAAIGGDVRAGSVAPSSVAPRWPFDLLRSSVTQQSRAGGAPGAVPVSPEAELESTPALRLGSSPLAYAPAQVQRASRYRGAVSSSRARSHSIDPVHGVRAPWSRTGTARPSTVQRSATTAARGDVQHGSEVVVAARGGPGQRPGDLSPHGVPGNDSVGVARLERGRDAVRIPERVRQAPLGVQRPHRALPWLAAVLLAAAVVALLARRRRPMPSAPRATLVAPPLPLHLPRTSPYAYPVVRTDGSSVLPDIALAWPDRDRGTSLDIDTHEHALARAPEHA